MRNRHELLTSLTARTQTINSWLNIDTIASTEGSEQIGKNFHRSFLFSLKIETNEKIYVGDMAGLCSEGRRHGQVSNVI